MIANRNCYTKDTKCVVIFFQHSWANMGLINYAMEAFPSSLSAFRKAVQLSSEHGGTSLSGRLANNMACVNAEDTGKLAFAQSEFEESVRVQKDNSPDGSFETNSSAGEDLLSISITIFNIGIVCAKQKQYQSAIAHVEASLNVSSLSIQGNTTLHSCPTTYSVTYRSFSIFVFTMIVYHATE